MIKKNKEKNHKKSLERYQNLTEETKKKQQEHGHE